MSSERATVPAPKKKMTRKQLRALFDLSVAGAHFGRGTERAGDARCEVWMRLPRATRQGLRRGWIRTRENEEYNKRGGGGWTFRVEFTPLSEGALAAARALGSCGSLVRSTHAQ